jgi:hypothetical protein
MIYSGPSRWLVQNLAILYRNRRHRSHPERASMVRSILCSLLNKCLRCFAGHFQTTLLGTTSTASPTGSPKSLPKRATSRRPENGQRLAGQACQPCATAQRLGVQIGHHQAGKPGVTGNVDTTLRFEAISFLKGYLRGQTDTAKHDLEARIRMQAIKQQVRLEGQGKV